MLDRAHAPQSRQLAFDWLVRIDPSAADRLVPGMLDDPSAEFRRAAVQRLIDAAAKANEAKDAAKGKELYLRAFRAALDPDQLDLAFDELSKMGEKPDLKSQLGLLSSWWLIGPFDHRNGIGFDAVYPPETEIDLQKKYTGTFGEVSWLKKESDERHAILDLNKLIAPHKGAVAYAYREFESDRAQPVEIRLGTPNGWKLWVNGKLVFAHEEYHLLTQMDQYRPPATLQAGTNRILLKICQNEQTEDWAQDWQFQVRVCDSSGTAVLPLNAKLPDTAGQVRRESADPHERELMRGLAFILSLIVLSGNVRAEDWRQFRGNDSSGVSSEPNLPTKLDEAKALKWKTSLPGRGLSGPVVIGDRVFLTASSGYRDDRLHVLCFSCCHRRTTVGPAIQGHGAHRLSRSDVHGNSAAVQRW